MDGGSAELTGYPLAGIDGAVGRVVSTLDPDGYVLVEGLLLRAASAAGPVAPGVQVHLLRRPGHDVLSARPLGEGFPRG